jgi:seryl-tRNA synthetase
MHNNFFGNRFNISCDGQPAFTGCVGLGLERWLLAIFTQHGFEPENWPALLQSDVFG